MASKPFIVERFGGLDLRTDPSEVGPGAAFDVLDCDFDLPGRVRCRSGSLKLNASTLASGGYQQLYPYASAAGDLIAIRNPTGAGTPIDKITSAGVTTNLGTIAGTNPFARSATTLGTLTSTVLYMTFVDSGAGVTIRKWDGTTLGTGTGKPTHVATWPTSNRLVQGGYFAAADSPSGANGSRSTVFFSDAGAPDTYTANNFVTLRPGDGEVITAIVAWRELLFVFKQSAVFVFTGESTSVDGLPIFNYRRVDLPSGIVAANAPRTYAVAGTDAVYISTASGIWRTAGGPPEIFSRAVDPIFSANTAIANTVRFNATPPSLFYGAQRLICSYTAASGALRQLVWTEVGQAWTLWSLPAAAFAQFTLGSAAAFDSDSLAFATGNNVAQTSATLSTDDGAAIPWTYKSGHYNLSEPGRAAVTLESRLWGSGSVVLKVANDYGALDTGSTLTLGTFPAADDAWQQVDREGVLWQHQLSGTGGEVVSALAHYISFVKPPGVQ